MHARYTTLHWPFNGQKKKDWKQNSDVGRMREGRKKNKTGRMKSEWINKRET